MSIQTEIDRITANIAATYAVLEETGGTMPSEQNSDNLAQAVRSAMVKGTIPQLTLAQRNAMMTVLNGYYNNRLTENKPNFIYFGASSRNTYAAESNGSVKSAYENGRFKMNCSLFAQLVWAGIEAKNFVGKRTSYTGAVTNKGFGWGYYFQFPWRKFAGMRKNSNPNGYFGFVKPNADSDIATYSMNTYYSVNGEGTYKQFFYTYMTAADMARELKFLGCEVPLSEVMPGDLVFFKASRIRDERLDDSVDNTINDGLYMNIDHVAIVTNKTSPFDITYCDCSEYWGDKTISACKISDLTSSSPPNGAHAVDLSNRIVMVARHPHAFGIESRVPSTITSI